MAAAASVIDTNNLNHHDDPLIANDHPTIQQQRQRQDQRMATMEENQWKIEQQWCNAMERPIPQYKNNPTTTTRTRNSDERDLLGFYGVYFDEGILQNLTQKANHVIGRRMKHMEEDEATTEPCLFRRVEFYSCKFFFDDDDDNNDNDNDPQQARPFQAVTDFLETIQPRHIKICTDNFGGFLRWGWSPRDTLVFLRGLQQCSGQFLRSLQFSFMDLSHQGVVGPLCEILAQQSASALSSRSCCQRLSQLTFERCKIDVHTARELGRGLQRTRSLTNLKFHKCLISEHASVHMLMTSMIELESSLQSLEMTYTWFSHILIITLAQILDQHPHLRTLRLNTSPTYTGPSTSTGLVVPPTIAPFLKSLKRHVHLEALHWNRLHSRTLDMVPRRNKLLRRVQRQEPDEEAPTSGMMMDIDDVTPKNSLARSSTVPKNVAAWPLLLKQLGSNFGDGTPLFFFLQHNAGEITAG